MGSPVVGKLKVNIDAGWAGKEGTGFGLVIRDERGKFQASAAHYVPYRMDPLLAEALCLRWSLNLVVDWGLDDVIFSSDCKQLVDAYAEPQSFPALFVLLQDCLGLARNFSFFQFMFEPRGTNRVAHTLAANSFTYKDCTWWDNPPVDILLSLAADSPDVDSH